MDWLSLERIHASFPLLGGDQSRGEDFLSFAGQELFVSIQEEANTNYKYFPFDRRRLVAGSNESSG